MTIETGHCMHTTQDAVRGVPSIAARNVTQMIEATFKRKATRSRAQLVRRTCHWPPPSKAKMRPLMIVDLDLHLGDGTRASSKNVAEVYGVASRQCCSLCRNAESCRHRVGTRDAEYLRRLDEALAPTRERFEPESTIYVSESDPTTAIPLGRGQHSDRPRRTSEDPPWKIPKDGRQSTHREPHRQGSSHALVGRMRRARTAPGARRCVFHGARGR